MWTTVLAVCMAVAGGFLMGAAAHDPVAAWWHRLDGRTRVVTIRGPRGPKAARRAKDASVPTAATYDAPPSI